MKDPIQKLEKNVFPYIIVFTLISWTAILLLTLAV